MIRKIASTIFALILIGIIGVGYLYYRQISKPKNPVINYILPDANLIIRSKNLSNSVLKFEKSGIGSSIKQLSTFKQFKSNIVFIDSLLKENNINYTESYFSLQKGDTSNIWMGYFVVNSEAKFSLNVGQKEKQIEIKLGPNGLYYFLHNNTLVTTRSKIYLQKTIAQLETKKSLLQQKEFKELYDAADYSADINIYSKYNGIADLLHNNRLNLNKDVTSLVSKIGYWIAVDINTLNNKLTYNGYSSSKTNTTFNLFSNQPTQNIEVTKILPVNTASFFYFGFEDFNEYHSNRTSQTPKNYQSYITKVENTYGIALEDYFLNWIDNEICIGYQKNDGIDKVANAFTVIKSKDVIETKNILADLVNLLAKKTSLNLEPKLYRGYQIDYLNLKGLLPNMFGKYFAKMEYNFYTVIDDYVVFANNYRTIQSLIDHYYKKQTLNYNSDYSKLSSQLDDKANLYFYYNIPLSEKELTEIIPEKIKAEFTSNFKNFKNIESACIQFSNENNTFYTNGIVKYNPNYTEIDIDKWEIELLATVSQTPQLIINKQNQQQEIIFQDDSNNVYLLSLDGKIIFQTKADSKILGKIHQIDFYKNNKFQYIFNTANKIYIIDRDGQNIEYFPVKFKHQATNGLSVFDYDNNKDYRFVMATKNNELINITREAKLTNGWNKFKLKNTVSTPIIHFTKKGKDYIHCKDNTGKEYFINRRGRKIINKPDTIIQATTIKTSLNIDSLSENSSFRGLPYATTDTTLSHFIVGDVRKIKSYRLQ